MSKTFKTPKGTELPFLNLKGKDYLQVQHRLIWFREEKPDWGIATEFLQLTENVAIARATITDPQGRVIAQGTKAETPESFAGGYIEKAESGSIGRALAFIGYGTQFAQELDDEQIVDSPQAPRGSRPQPLQAVPSDPGAVTVPFEKSSQHGVRIDALTETELQKLGEFLAKLKPPMKPETAAFKAAFEAYVQMKYGVAK
jgi:hypothetical protein